MITTTLRKLKDADACIPRYTVLREALGKDYGLNKEIALTKILETNGRDDVLWALNSAVEGGDKILQLWSADCAEHVLHFFEEKYPDDKRPRRAIEATRQFARGEIGAAARAAAWDAADAADASRDAAWDAAWAAAWAAADAARAAAWAAADAARAAEDNWQTDRLIAYLNEAV